MFNAVTRLGTLILMASASLSFTCTALAASADNQDPEAVLDSTSSSAPYAQHSSPKGYAAICSYGESCAVTKPSLVAFGSHGQYVYKIVTGAFLCSERTFNRNPTSTESAHCSVAGITPKKPLTTPKHLSATDIDSGRYIIVSRHSGKALTVDQNGRFLQTQFTGEQSQQFVLTKRDDGYFTINTLRDQALEVKDWNTSDGAKVSTAEPVESWSQQWSLSDAETGHIAITSRFSGKALDLVAMNISPRDNAPLRLWTYWGGKNQQWQLLPASKEANTSEQ
ncbi:MAG TPA: RICIN domain-containing protein [Marinagarivorans sp.]